jgi:hypothetical protein
MLKHPNAGAMLAAKPSGRGLPQIEACVPSRIWQLPLTTQSGSLCRSDIRENVSKIPPQTESFGADPLLVGIWLVLTGFPIPFVIFIVVRDGFRPDIIQLLCVALSPPLAVLVFMLRFRVTFTANKFIYQRWGPTIEVPYADIAEIDVTNVTRVEQQPIGAFVVTKCGERHPFWPKLFPRRAVERFFLMRP